MTRIPEEFTHSVCFLYQTEVQAEKNAKVGGTGFVVGKTLEKASEATGRSLYHPFAVSNRHVVWDSGCSVIRMNKRDGSKWIHPLDPNNWAVHPDGSDLAAVSLMGDLKKDEVEVTTWKDSEFVTEKFIEEVDLGIGDEVVMIGRFINHQGREKINPAVRFGNICMMPEPIWNSRLKHDELSFAVEMRSRGGFSGSPVYVYRTPATNITQTKTEKTHFQGILGVSWGYIYHKDDDHPDMDGENTWLNGVVPAWKILDILELPQIQKFHDFIDEKIVEGENKPLPKKFDE